MHSNNRQFKSVHASPSPSQPRQENTAPPLLRRSLLKQEDVPVRSPFLRLSNNKTVKQQLPSSLDADGAYTEGHRSFSSHFSGSQLSRAAAKPGYRHSLQPGVNLPLAQVSRLSYPSAAAGSEKYNSEQYDTYQDPNASHMYNGSRVLTQHSFRTELESSPIPSGADNYDRILDTEILSRANTQIASDNERASSVVSIGPPRKSSQPAELRRSQSKAAHATEALDAEESGLISEITDRLVSEKRNLRATLEKKDEELARLSDHVNAAAREREVLSNKIKAIKHKVKEGMTSTKQSLEHLESRVRELKEQTEATKRVSESMQFSAKALDDVKHEVEESNEKLRNTFDENGSYMPTQEWRATIEQMRFDFANKQHMLDMFRDKLEFAQGELAEAKNRVVEFEGKQARDGQAIESTYRQIDDLNTKLHELGTTLNSQRERNCELLVEHAALQAMIETRDNKCMSNDAHLKKSEEDLKTTKKNLDDVREQLQDKEIQLKVLGEQKTDMEAKLSKAGEEELKIRGQLASEEALHQQLVLLTNIRSRLENDLELERTRVEAEVLFRSKIVQENNERVAKIDSLTGHICELKLKVKESDNRNDTLQERLEGQTLMLTMEKKTHGDLQARTSATEQAHKEEMENMKRLYELTIATLERKLESSETELASKAKEHSDSLANAKAGFKEQFQLANERLSDKADAFERVSAELKDLVSKLDEQTGTNQDLQRELQTQKSMRKVEQLSEADIIELRGLKQQYSDALKKIDDLENRARSLDKRYKNGDLSPEELALIESVIRSTQTSHEQQLQAKGNEIRQRENIIKGLEKRKSQLEIQLARALDQQIQKKADGTPNDSGKSRLIDLAQWASSSSPPRDRSSVKAMKNIEDAEDDDSGSDTPVAKGRAPPKKAAAPIHASSKPSKTADFKNRPQARGHHADPFDEIPQAGVHAAGSVMKRKHAAINISSKKESAGVGLDARTTRSMSKGSEDIGGVEEHPGHHEEGHEPKTKARKRHY